MKRSHRIAAIDVGTNSIHMIIAEATTRGFRVIDREKEMVQLGRGSLEGRPLSEEAVARGVDALTRMAAIARRHHVDEVRCVATSAVREAPNGSQFARMARDAAGIDVRIIDGDEEAAYIWRAVVGSVDFHGATTLCVDIGGGSMELIVGDENHISFAQSRPLGSLRLTQLFFNGDGSTRKAIETCREHIRRELREPIARIRSLGFDQVVGTSGTIVSLAKLSGEGREAAAGILILERTSLSETVDALASMTPRDRAAAYALELRRAETILAGGVLLDEVLRLAGATRMLVTTSALREGLVMRALDERRGVPESRETVRRSAVLDLAERAGIDMTHAHHVEHLATRLFDELGFVHGLGEEARDLLSHAAVLREIGQQVSWERYHKHTYYIISHAALPGFTDSQMLMLAAVARYHRKAKPTLDDDALSALRTEERDAVVRLAALLRLAHVMDRSRRQSIVDLRVERAAAAEALTLRLESRDSDVDVRQIEKAAAYLGELLGQRLSIEETTQAPKSVPGRS